MNNIESAKPLDQLLQGEYMAVEAFNVFISNIRDENVKTTFQEVQDTHRNNIKTLANYIQNIGGQPHETLGFKGTYADMKLNFALSKNNDVSDVIKKAIEGEVQGVNMAEKVLRGELDNKSRDIAGEILHKDRNALDKLRALM